MKRLTDEQERETYMGNSDSPAPMAPPSATEQARVEPLPAGVKPDRRPHALSRLLAAALLGLLTGLGVYAMEAHRHAMGKDAFLASQAQWWDQRYADTHAGVVVTMTLAVAAAAGVYELLALGIHKALHKDN
jgi:hypothetical protein